MTLQFLRVRCLLACQPCLHLSIQPVQGIQQIAPRIVRIALEGCRQSPKISPLYLSKQRVKDAWGQLILLVLRDNVEG